MAGLGPSCRPVGTGRAASPLADGDRFILRNLPFQQLSILLARAD